jgi:DNA-binding response OmpR family regulator
MSLKILVVEDDLTLRETLNYNLVRQGYVVTVVADGKLALAKALEIVPDLVLLDIMLPGMDGMEICRRLRQEMSVPILMLTARTDEVDRVVGLEMGADDYITKPFSMRELMARVKAQLRRVQLTREEVEAEVREDGKHADGDIPTGSMLTFGNLTIDGIRREVLLDDKPVRMKPKEYELLAFLARHRGIALSRDLLLERVWGWTYDGSSRTVDVHVSWLREKIESDPGHASRIVTVRGIGYRFEG